MKEIAYLLNFKNHKQLANLNFRKYKLERFYPKLYCKRCRKILTKDQEKFCSKSCAAIVNNKNVSRGRGKSKILKCSTCQKLKEVSIHTSIFNCKECKRRLRELKNKNTCNRCGSENIEKHKQYCNSCKKEYYELYRPSCEFNFDPRDYNDWFDCSEINILGKYSPSNRGNNLGGVSRDHMLSVKDGFRMGIDPSIISHPANCEIMVHDKNNRKNSRSSITKAELVYRINLWNIFYSK